ncbi:MAG: gamma-glutamyltransferase [Gemmatimonadetes bacterium]|nr:gamma-glutamyltransferase [Gemmatimonadota bacterium]
MSPLLSRTIASSRAKLNAYPAARAIFLPDSEPLRPGALLVQPALAATLEGIAAGGAEAFYKGAIAEQLARDVQARGGLITAHDMSRYPVAEMIPLCRVARLHRALGAAPMGARRCWRCCRWPRRRGSPARADSPIVPRPSPRSPA